MVKSTELQDSLLSACISNKRTQAIAYSYGAYSSIGKLGAYDRVIEELESRPLESSTGNSQALLLIHTALSRYLKHGHLNEGIPTSSKSTIP